MKQDGFNPHPGQRMCFSALDQSALPLRVAAKTKLSVPVRFATGPPIPSLLHHGKFPLKVFTLISLERDLRVPQSDCAPNSCRSRRPHLESGLAIRSFDDKFRRIGRAGGPFACEPAGPLLGGIWDVRDCRQWREATNPEDDRQTNNGSGEHA